MARKIIGIVVSDAQDKTIVVALTRRVTHPLYGKQYTITKKFAAHDEQNEARIGDKVELTESRPISKRKTWRLSRMIEVAPKADVTVDEASAADMPAPDKADGHDGSEKAVTQIPQEAA